MAASEHEALWVSIATASAVAHIDLNAAALSAAVAWLVLTSLRGDHGTLRLRTVHCNEAELSLRGALQQAGLIQLAELTGPLQFLSVARIDRLVSERPPWPRYLILDLRGVTRIDSTALRALHQAIDFLQARDGRLLLICRAAASAASCELAERALGRTGCLTVAQALQQIASQHVLTPAVITPSTAPSRPMLRLVRAAAEGE